MEGKSLRLDKKLDDSTTPFTGEGRFFSRFQVSPAFTHQVRPAYEKTTKMREREKKHPCIRILLGLFVIKNGRGADLTSNFGLLFFPVFDDSR